MRPMVSVRRVPYRLSGIGITVAVVVLVARLAAADGDGANPDAAPPLPAADAVALEAVDAAVPLPADLMLPPELAPAPPLTLEAPAPAPIMPLRSHRPFYRRDWFWGAIGVAIMTTVIVLLATSGSGSQQPPATTLGNMRAF